MVLFDATHGTNGMRLKLAPFVTISKHGQSVILAFVLIDTESIEDVEWALRSFHEVFKTAPSVFMTDSAGSIAIAFARLQESGIWRLTVHLLCVFHLSKNFFDHISKVVKDRPSFHSLTNTFWNLAKESDLNSVDTWDEEWGAFVQKFTDSAGSTCSDAYGKALLWLKALGERNKAKKFAYRFTCQYTTFLMHATVRSEAINKAVKQRVTRSNMKVTDLVKGLVQYNVDARAEREISAIRKATRQYQAAGGLPPYVECLRSQVTPYAFELICAQAVLSVKYRVKLVTWNETLAEAEAEAEAGEDLEGDEAIKLIKSYQVSLYDPTTQLKSRQITLNSSGELDQGDGFEDVGLVECNCVPSGTRIVSLAKCSCQWDVSSGLDTCRHRLALMGALWHCMPVDKVKDYVCVSIAAKWRVLSADQESDALRVLRNLPIPAVPNPAIPPPTVIPCTTKADRFAMLMSEFRTLANYASASPKITTELLSRAQKMLRSLHDGTFLAAEPDPSPTAASAVQTAAARATFEQNVDSDSLRKVLGLTLTPDESECNDSWFEAGPTTCSLIGRYLAYKYEALGKGGWYIGQITAMLQNSQKPAVAIWDQDGTFSREATPNFTVKFNDGILDVLLLPLNYARNPFLVSAESTWVILKQKDMDDSAGIDLSNVSVVAPPNVKAKGKKPTVRLAPSTPGAPTGRKTGRERRRTDGEASAS